MNLLFFEKKFILRTKLTYMKPSELILNPDGSIYHLHLLPEHIANTIITVGDPDRVAKVSKYFDRIDIKIQKREFVTHTGWLGTKRLSVISTGIGTDNIDIVLNELDALVNIDLKTKQIKEKLTALKIIRIGTSGCLQPDIPVDSFLVSTHGIGLDSLYHFYEADRKETLENQELKSAFEKYLIPKKAGLPNTPYLCAGSTELLEQMGTGMYQGITLTCPGFYAPQGRTLRLPARFKNLLDIFQNFQYQDYRCTNFEMETAGIYALAQLMGHHAISFNALLANRATGHFSPHPKKTTERLIQLVLERL